MIHAFVPPVDEIVLLRKEVAELRRSLMSGRKVDLVDFQELRVFMYTDDLGYQQVDPAYRNAQPGLLPEAANSDTRSPAQRFENPNEPLISLLLSHLWLQEIEFSVLDVGCQYGSSSIATAQIIRRCGKANRVFAFDPGIAGRLAPYNILMNRLDDLVSFEPLAVTDASHPLIVYTELGHSENNRVVDRSSAVEFQSYVTLGTSIDHFLAAKQIRGDLFAKIDTQGGEVQVLRGMARTLAEQSVLMIMEFTPQALSTRVDVTDWLRKLSLAFDISEIKSDPFLSPAAVTVVKPDALAAYVDEVEGRKAPYTDLLLIPKRLRGAAVLRQRLADAW